MTVRHNPQKDIVLFFLGKMEEKMGQKTKALSRYDEIINNHDDSIYLTRARERKIALMDHSTIQESIIEQNKEEASAKIP